MSPQKRRGPQASRSRPSRPAAGREETVLLTVERVGAQGDGAALHDGRRVYAPRTAAGDVVRATVTRGGADADRARVEEIVSPGPGRRAAPPCPHVDRCGGCSVQHLDDETYADWKQGVLRDALNRAGFGDAPIAPMVGARPGERRRARFALLRRGRYVFAGYNERASKLLVDLTDCPVSVPALPALLPGLRTLMLSVLRDGEGCDAAATLTAGGVDLLLIGPARLDLDARVRLAAFAEAADLARLSWRPDETGATEPVAARRPAFVDFAGVPAATPAGGFLQATAAGETALRTEILQATAGAGKIVDLFCGAGTFSLPLAARIKAEGGRKSGVAAFDGDREATAALAQAGARAQLPLTAQARDLFRDPLSAAELRAFDAAVFDPPRAGAAAQAAELARSGVPVVAAASCNPTSFVRDARTLVDGGYALTRVVPVDQFLWSAHLELVAVFEKRG